MTLTTTKVYAGTCDRTHSERDVLLVLDDGSRNNDHSAKMVRCAECRQIVKCDPDPDRLAEVMQG
jgi:hypothetical protein